MRTIIGGILAAILLGITGFMIYADKPNWGWVLFAAIIVSGDLVVELSEDKKSSR